MRGLNLIRVLCLAAFALGATQTFAQTFKVDEILANFSELMECDGSKKAEEVCKRHCTGDGVLMKGTCSEQSIWEKCRTICRKDWIEDCAATAAKLNLRGLPQCQ